MEPARGLSPEPQTADSPCTMIRRPVCGPGAGDAIQPDPVDAGPSGTEASNDQTPYRT